MKGQCGCGSKKLCAGALGMGFGVATGLFMMMFAWAGLLWGYGGSTIMDEWSLVYPGYAPTFGGGIIGFFWGLLEGFLIGLIIGLIYNLICRACRCSTCVCTCNTDMNRPRV